MDQNWLRAQLQVGIEEADRGELLDEEEVFDDLLNDLREPGQKTTEAGQIKHERLKSDIRAAIEQSDRGELIDADEVFERLERELQEPEVNGA